MCGMPHRSRTTRTGADTPWRARAPALIGTAGETGETDDAGCARPHASTAQAMTTHATSRGTIMRMYDPPADEGPTKDSVLLRMTPFVPRPALQSGHTMTLF